MKFASAALLLLLLSASTFDDASAFSPSFVPRTAHTLGRSTFVVRGSKTDSRQRRSSTTRTTTTSTTSALKSTLSMFAETSGGMEELQELMERADTLNPLNKRVRKSPSFFKLAGVASIPLSAALGFVSVPSRRFAAHTVGAVVTAIAGAVGKSKIDALTEANAKPALAQAIVDNGLSNVDATVVAVDAVREQFGLLEEDFETLCGEVYASYLLGMVKYNPLAKTSELKELENLKNALQLDNLQIGEAHCAAATEWYRTTCLFTPEEELDDPDHPDYQAMNKLLFLTERALRQAGETPEAFTFEMTRVAKALHLGGGSGSDALATALERVAETAEPFYQRALRSTRTKLGSHQVSGEMLERARRTLGISDETAFDMHVAAFNEEVKELLGLATVPKEGGDLGESAGLGQGEDGDDDEAGGAAVPAQRDLSNLRFSEGAMERVSD